MKSVSEILGNTKSIPGFKVMEWLRGVRDEHYRLSIEDPEAYRKMREEARKSLRKKQKAQAKKLQPA